MKLTFKQFFLRFKQTCACLIVVLLCLQLIVPPPHVLAQGLLQLPMPGTLVQVTPAFHPAIIRGMTIHPDNPFAFDFMIDPGQSGLQDQSLNDEASKLMRYFLAALTVPEQEMWVNLSPYEKNRIIPDTLRQTEMGRDLLAQDYLLKQLSASLMYPEDELGQRFWKRVRARAQKEFGTTDIPMNTFNKVWIVPDTAKIYIHDNNVFVADSHLKVMIEEDYLALERNSLKGHTGDKVDDVVTGLQSEIVREILIPEIEREVNEGELFANLRQIYHSMILATWYKTNLKNSVLSQVYVDQNKVEGVDVDDPQVHQKIYDQYVEAFKRGVYNYIKEDLDEESQQVVPRQYFAGGVAFDQAQVSEVRSYQQIPTEGLLHFQTRIDAVTDTGVTDAAMLTLRPTVDDFITEPFRELTQALDFRVEFERVYSRDGESFARLDARVTSSGSSLVVASQIGRLMFVSADFVDQLDAQWLEQNKSNLIVLERFNSLFEFEMYSTPMIFEMIRLSHVQRHWVDSGAGTGILGLVALKLGQPFVHLVERYYGKNRLEPEKLTETMDIFAMNGYEQGRDYQVHAGDLKDSDFIELVSAQVTQKAESAGLSVGVVSNIGTWREYYGVNNRTSMQFLADIPSADLIIAGGYDDSHEFLNARYVDEDIIQLRAIGFEADPIFVQGSIRDTFWGRRQRAQYVVTAFRDQAMVAESRSGYESDVYPQIYEDIVADANRRHPIVLVSGLSGSGKSTFTRGLIEHLQQRGRQAVYIKSDWFFRQAEGVQFIKSHILPMMALMNKQTPGSGLVRGFIRGVFDMTRADALAQHLDDLQNLPPRITHTRLEVDGVMRSFELDVNQGDVIILEGGFAQEVFDAVDTTASVLIDRHHQLAQESVIEREQQRGAEFAEAQKRAHMFSSEYLRKLLLASLGKFDYLLQVDDRTQPEFRRVEQELRDGLGQTDRRSRTADSDSAMIGVQIDDLGDLERITWQVEYPNVDVKSAIDFFLGLPAIHDFDYRKNTMDPTNVVSIFMHDGDLVKLDRFDAENYAINRGLAIKVGPITFRLRADTIQVLDEMDRVVYEIEDSNLREYLILRTHSLLNAIYSQFSGEPEPTVSEIEAIIQNMQVSYSMDVAADDFVVRLGPNRNVKFSFRTGAVDMQGFQLEENILTTAQQAEFILHQAQLQLQMGWSFYRANSGNYDAWDQWPGVPTILQKMSALRQPNPKYKSVRSENPYAAPNKVVQITNPRTQFRRGIEKSLTARFWEVYDMPINERGRQVLSRDFDQPEPPLLFVTREQILKREFVYRHKGQVIRVRLSNNAPALLEDINQLSFADQQLLQTNYPESDFGDWRHSLRIVNQSTIRVSTSAYGRLKIDDKYLVIRFGQSDVDGAVRYTALGGGIHMTEAGREFLLDLKATDFEGDGEPDLRFTLATINLGRFENWFDRRTDRELDPDREIYEELVEELGIFSAADVAQLLSFQQDSDKAMASPPKPRIPDVERRRRRAHSERAFSMVQQVRDEIHKILAGYNHPVKIENYRLFVRPVMHDAFQALLDYLDAYNPGSRLRIMDMTLHDEVFDAFADEMSPEQVFTKIPKMIANGAYMPLHEILMFLEVVTGAFVFDLPASDRPVPPVDMDIDEEEGITDFREYHRIEELEIYPLMQFLARHENIARLRRDSGNLYARYQDLVQWDLAHRFPQQNSIMLMRSTYDWNAAHHNYFTDNPYYDLISDAADSTLVLWRVPFERIEDAWWLSYLPEGMDEHSRFEEEFIVSPDRRGDGVVEITSEQQALDFIEKSYTGDRRAQLEQEFKLFKKQFGQQMGYMDLLVHLGVVRGVYAGSEMKRLSPLMEYYMEEFHQRLEDFGYEDEEAESTDDAMTSADSRPDSSDLIDWSQVDQAILGFDQLQEMWRNLRRRSAVQLPQKLSAPQQRPVAVLGHWHGLPEIGNELIRQVLDFAGQTRMLPNREKKRLNSNIENQLSLILDGQYAEIIQRIFKDLDRITAILDRSPQLKRIGVEMSPEELQEATVEAEFVYSVLFDALKQSQIHNYGQRARQLMLFRYGPAVYLKVSDPQRMADVELIGLDSVALKDIFIETSREFTGQVTNLFRAIQNPLVVQIINAELAPFYLDGRLLENAQAQARYFETLEGLLVEWGYGALLPQVKSIKKMLRRLHQTSWLDRNRYFAAQIQEVTDDGEPLLVSLGSNHVEGIREILTSQNVLVQAALEFDQWDAYGDQIVFDKALLSQDIDEARRNNPGGIDLDAAHLDITIDGDARGVELNKPMMPINAQEIRGFVPVIIQVVPITNMPLLLGQESVPPSQPDKIQPDVLAYRDDKFRLDDRY